MRWASRFVCVSFLVALTVSCAIKPEEHVQPAGAAATAEVAQISSDTMNGGGSVRTATCSSVQSEELSASLAIDGNRSTRWGSLFSDPQWLEIDYGEPKDLVGVILYWENAYAYAYTISVSSDRTRWTPVFTTDKGDGGKDDVDFDPVTARYLRIECLHRATGFGNSLWEVEAKTRTEPWGEGEAPDIFLLDSSRQVYVPAAWSNSKPIIWTKAGIAPAPALRFGHRQDIQVTGVTVLARSEAALQDGLRWLLQKDSRDYYRLLEKLEPEGVFPYWLSGQQGFWTVVGADGDFKESLFCQDGTLEPYKSFSIFPFVYLDGRLITRADVTLTQELDAASLPIPSVTWTHPKFRMTIRAFGAGEPGKTTTYLTYTVRNTSGEPWSGKLFLAWQPFEVNPPWQWGGFTRIGQIEYDGRSLRANEYTTVLLTPASSAGAATAREGGILRYIEKGELPKQESLRDPDGLASAAVAYELDLGPGQEREIDVAVPLHSDATVAADSAAMKALSDECIRSWESRLSTPNFTIPDADYAETLKANLAFIFVNRDGPAVQPGSRGYEAAWIRDGAMSCSALLRMGYTNEVREYLDWYARYIYPDGRVPAIVIIGRNEVNPVKEYDSQGEFVYLCAEYYRFTKDKAYVEAQWPAIRATLAYLQMIREQESATGAVGILPRSVSHEGYYPEPGNHSYWDDFWALKGWKDGAAIAQALGKTNDAAWAASEGAKLREAMLSSIDQEMKRHGIDFIPGCAELGDFDPTSTAIAIVACHEQAFLPEAALKRTFDRYYEELLKRTTPGWTGSFSPYEIRTAQAFLYMNQKDRALRLLEYMMTCRRPAGWKQWAEAVYFPPEQGGFIGDMPHTWVSAGFLHTVRSMFCYEHEGAHALVLAAGIPESWLDGGREVGVTDAPTYWGRVSFRMRKSGSEVRVSIAGDVRPPAGIMLQSPLSLPLHSVTVNGQPAAFRPGNAVVVNELPAEIVLGY